MGQLLGRDAALVNATERLSSNEEATAQASPAREQPSAVGGAAGAVKDEEQEEGLPVFAKSEQALLSAPSSGWGFK
jgi:hypothetical protein